MTNDPALTTAAPAPADCSEAKSDPAATLPIEACQAAAIDPGDVVSTLLRQLRRTGDDSACAEAECRQCHKRQSDHRSARDQDGG